MTHVSSAAPQTHRLRSRLTRMCLILVLMATSLALAVGLRPDHRPATAAQADVPLTLELLTWPQRTAGERAAGDAGSDWESHMIWEGTNTLSGAAGFGILHLVDAFAPFSWQQHTYRDWHGDARSDVVLATDFLAPADTGQFPAGTPNRTVVAPLDVDGDDDVDLAVGASGVNGLYKNDGAGQYTRVEAGAFDDHAFNTRALAALDVEGDGDLDLAEINFGAANAVYLNDGAGIFTQVDPGGFGSAGWIRFLTTLDANGDGLADLAGPHTIYLGSGTGSFAWFDAGAYTSMGFQYTTGIVAFDADGDGDDDLAVANSGRDLIPCYPYYCDDEDEPNVLFLNDGTGRYSLAGNLHHSYSYSIAIEAGDVDDDGDIDLVIGNQGWCSYNPQTNIGACWSESEIILLNNGSGSFAEAPGAISGGGGWTYDLAAADLDGDGDLDLITTNQPLGGDYSNTDETPNSIYLNDGSGHFSRVASAVFEGADYRQPLIAFDASGDGAGDILFPPLLVSRAVAPACTALGYDGFVLVNAGNFAGFVALVAFDANGDGYADLAGKAERRNRLYLNDGTGSFSQVDAGQLDDSDSNTWPMAPIDVDRDGDVDLALGGQPNEFFVNDGNGTFTRADAGAFDDPATIASVVVAFDADGDGDVDLATGGSGPEALYLNDGQAEFTLAASGDYGSSAANITVLAAIKADGDADVDLLAISPSSSYLRSIVYLNDGQGVFAATDPGDLGVYQYGFAAIAVLDADRDGTTDVARASGGSNGGIPDALYLNDGHGTFQHVPSLLDLSRETNGIGAFDADADGDQDIVATSGWAWGYGTVLLLNDGTGRFTLGDAGDFEQFSGTVMFLDADGDGDDDILSQSGAAIYANENLSEAGALTSPVIAPSELYPNGGALTGWNALQVAENNADQTTITYDVLDPATGQPLPGFAGLRPNAAGQVSLAGIDPYLQRSIQLRAHLADHHTGSDWPGYTPQLCGWQVSFQMGPGTPPPPTATPTRTPTVTPTATPAAPTSTPTATATPTGTPLRRYLPLILHQ